MSEHMHLIGTEEVVRAARTMAGAAENMLRAAYHIESTIERLQRVLDEHASRVEAAVERLPKA